MKIEAAAAAKKNTACFFLLWMYSGDASARAKLSFLSVGLGEGVVAGSMLCGVELVWG